MSSHNRRTFVRASGAAAALASLGLTSAASAQTLDVVKIVTGFPPGGTSDTLCRRVADRLRGDYTRNALVENKAGAGGQIAVQSMKGAAIDGSSYDAFTDVTPITLACNFDFGLAVGPAVPETVKTVPEFLAWCKANPGSANFGSPAAGSVPHFIGVLLGKSAGIELKQVPYRGSPPAIQDLVGGQVQAVSAPVGEFIQQVAAGKIRLLGVSGAKRSRFAPTVPTYVEQGLKDMAFSEWFGFFAPGGTPESVIQRANGALRTALASQDVIDGLAVMGLEVASSTPAELTALLKASYDRWGPIVKQIGFTADS